jgi:hypothetical protein
MASKANRHTVEIEDVGGSFARFIATAPKEVRARLSEAIATTTFIVSQRMKALAPVGPEAPHMRDAIEAQLPKRNGLSGRAGIFDNEEEASVALFNEYRPNEQWFMRPALLDSEDGFRARATRALQQVERNLSGGGLL